MKPSDKEIAKIREDSSSWAASILEDESVVYIDTETTGIPSKYPDTEIIQISLTNWKGRPLFVSMVRPVLGEVPEGASNCHGIFTEDLDSAPDFGEIADIVEGFIYNKTVVAYNADFDFALLATEFARLHRPRPQVASVQCAMDRYSAWNGEWSAKKNDFKWQKLPNLSGRLSHDALVDCENLHLLIQKMATGKEDESNITSDEININF